jgi:hypothetical protein
MTEAQTEASPGSGVLHTARTMEYPKWGSAIYVLALLISVSTWFIVIRAPPWLDETVSIFLIKGGFAGIMSRQVWPDSPAYSCLLWLWTKVMGTSKIMLRISSLLPMLAALRIQSGGAKR